MRNVWIVPGFSGDENDWCIPALLDLARTMARQCELHIVALHYPYRRDTYRIGGATVHSLGGSNRGGVSNLMLWWEAAHVVDRLRADVVHAFWAHPCGVIAAWLAPRTPIVVSLAGGELIDLPSIDYGLIGRWHVRVMLRRALRRANVITAGSKYLLNIARRFMPEGHFEFAPLGVDVTLFNGSPANQSRRIIHVGSLEPVKDHTTLLRAFRCMALAPLRGAVRVDRRPAAQLMFVGQGRSENPLRHLVRDLDLIDRVEFRGEVPHHHLPDVYRSAALFVQSSRHEAQGMALLEAAACGLPIVGTNVGALADLAPEAALAVPVGDVEALAGAMNAVIGDAERAARLGQAVQQVVAREYNLECTADRFMALYRAALGE